MQIDFHFSVTYVVARMAGFEHLNAHKIAYSAQYVDDATNQGNITFKNGAMYNHVSSAHKMLDYRNFEELSNHYAWIPFHFLPGNGGLPSGQNPSGSFIEKIVCKPNSYIAQDMIDTCLSHKDKPYSLHLLGITTHVFADTWAHQGFAGVTHKINSISNIQDDDPNENSIGSRLSSFFSNIFDKKASKLVSKIQPLGHGAALSHPDMPFLKWSYNDDKGQRVNRDNTALFMDAAEKIYAVYRRYLGFNDDTLNMSEENKAQLKERFLSFTDKNGDDRNEKWIRDIEEGKLGFDTPKLDYIAKGKKSWKFQAIGTEKEKDLDSDTFTFHPEFIKSDWKLFHDALQLHRYYVIHDILPRYGICVA